MINYKNPKSRPMAEADQSLERVRVFGNVE